jgi:hypothetical protein
MLKIGEFPIDRYTDRDCEIPNLLEFLKYYKGRYESLLDVGAHYSADYYAKEVRSLVKKYIAFDPLFDKEVFEIVDEFITADAVKDELPEADVVICLSTLEHVGQYPIHYDNYIGMREIVFKKILTAAKKFFWISIPVGEEYILPGEIALFTEREFENLEDLMKPFITDIGFFFSEGPQAGHPWRPSDREKCFNTPYDDKLGTRALCIIEGVV